MIVDAAIRHTSDGRFVVFEGLDGAGTSTQLELLRRWLIARNEPVEVTREPSNGPFGAVIRQVIESRVQLHPTALALAFAGDRADHLTNTVNGVEPALARGAWVLCNRYVLSSLAYQTTDEVDLEWLVDLNRFARTPDLTVFVDTAPAVCYERISSRSQHVELYHDRDELERVRQNYGRAVTYREFVGELITVDGSFSEQDVFAALLSKLEPWLGAAHVS